jgi:hypothetical protein
MLSGNDPSDDDRNTFLQAGAADFWVKPVTARQIEWLITSMAAGAGEL